MYVEKDQWILFISVGIFLTVLINLGLVIRDIKGIQTFQQSHSLINNYDQQ